MSDPDDEFIRRHIIHAPDGRLSEQHPASDPAQIDAVLDAAEGAAHGLVLHLHGGLVTTEAGIASARRLAAGYKPAEAHPAFLIWDSGFLPALQGELTDPVGRMLQGLTDAVADVLRAPVEGRGPVLAALEERVAADPDLLTSAEAVRAVGPIPPGQERSARASLAGRLSTPGYALLFQGVGLSLAQRLAAVLADVYEQVRARERAGRMHGGWQTIQEELIRKLRIGAIVWQAILTDITASFDDDDRAAGTALARALSLRADAGRLARLTIVAHSAGSIMACALLDALTDADLAIDLVLLAPAVSHARFYDALRRHDHESGALRRFRMATMRDELERADTVIHDRFEFFRHSLLYLISGALESEPDRPLLGMQRFLLADLDPVLSHRERAHGAAIRAFLADDERLLLATTADAPVGRRTLATSHGHFPHDPETLASIAAFIQEGSVQPARAAPARE